MKTNTKVKINKDIAGRFTGWARALSIPLESALQFAFNHLDKYEPIKIDQTGKKQFFPIEIDYQIWSRFKREICPKRGFDASAGVEAAMALFIEYYEDKIKEVL